MPEMTLCAYPLPWLPPLELARRLDAPCYVLLYSGVQASYSGRFSLLACDPAEVLSADSFAPLAQRLSHNCSIFDNAWFSCLGYGLKSCLERLPPDEPGILALPDLWMARFRTLYYFDHTEERLTCWSALPPTHPGPASSSNEKLVVREVQSNMTRTEYFDKVARLRSAIIGGDLYQANLTRKFHGRLSAPPDALALFKRLCALSPAPYSAFIRTPEFTLLSSSPERFLTVSADGAATTRPIKGSAPVSDDPVEDAHLARALQTSEKDRAENLMIVDLMRNDLARGCMPGSVRADSLFDVTRHATVHHLSSTVSGRKCADVTTLDLVQRCFPPGSMTGAPKIRAMEWCTRLERLKRGFYGGALGWFGGDGSCDLSVVIRTLMLQEDRFEFQVGGGIVADSTPEGEWRETLLKARAMAQTLGIPPERLSEI